jgi:hypothetical protein
MNKTALEKILNHPDKDELISKLVIGVSEKDIHDWLKAKYTNVSETKFVIAEKSITSFKDNYLDIYNLIHADIAKTKQAIATSTEDQLSLAVQNNMTYKSKMLEIASKEIDVRQIVAHLCTAIETRFAQVFDEIQEDPRNINTRVDRMLKEYGELLANLLEKYYKFTEAPADTIVQHSVTLQVTNQQIALVQDAIKEVLSQMDLEASMQFMELLSIKMNKLQLPAETDIPNVDIRLAEAKLLNETITKKANES